MQFIALRIARYTLNPVEIDNVGTMASDNVRMAFGGAAINNLGFESAEAAAKKWLNGLLLPSRVAFEVDDRAVVIARFDEEQGIGAKT